MERVFSMEDIPDPLWSLSPPMDQPHQVAAGDGGVATCNGAAGDDGAAATDWSPSEWTFERLLEEELLHGATPVDSGGSVQLHAEPVPPEVERGTTAVPVAASEVADEPVETNAMLKRTLEEDLAAVSMWRRASGEMHPERCRGSDNYAGGSDSYIGGNRRYDLVQSKFSCQSPGHLVPNANIRGKLAAGSSSSMQPEEGMDGEVEIPGFTTPNEEKWRKRKKSNRESARRARYRQAAHLKYLEDEVAHLRVQNSTLLGRLAALDQKYNAASVDNRALRADMEILIAKIKTAEGTLKRVMGMSCSPPSEAVPDQLPSLSMPPFIGSASDASLPIQSHLIDSFVAPTGAMGGNGFMPNMAPSSPNSNRTLDASRREISRLASRCTAAMEVLPPTSSGSPAPLGLLNETAYMGRR